MTKFKKYICAMLSAVMLISLVNIQAIDASDDNAYDEDVAVLVSLGIMQGAEGGMLNLGQDITRGEFATMITKMVNIGEYGGSKKFDDVSKNHWAFNAIGAASDMGYMSGDGNGNFRPDDTIVTEEAVKSLVSALGYATRAEDEGGYPNGYMSIGRKIGMFDKSTAGTGKPLKRREVSRIMYNCLEINLMEQVSYGDQIKYVVGDKTILKDCLNAIRIKGTVNANSEINLNSEIEIGEGKVVIGETLYYTGKTNISEALGSEVYAYVKMDKNDPIQTVIYYKESVNQKTITVKHSEINDETSESEFVYDEGGRNPKRIQIPKGVTVIVNGEAVFGFTAQTLKPTLGDVTLVTNNGKLSLVRINSYESRVLESVSETYKTIYYKGNVTPTKLEDSDVKYTIIKKDKEVDLDALEPFDIASVATSANGKNVKIIISNETIEGTLGEITSDRYSIDGRAFPVSKFYEGKASDLELGKVGTFYLDTFGEIVYADMGKGTLEYAYFVASDFAKELDTKLTLKILNIQGRIELTEVDTKATLNDEKRGLQGIYEKLGNTRQLIKIRKAADGKIRAIETAYDNTADPNPTYETDVFSKDMEGAEVRYKEQMFSDGQNLYCVPDKTLVLVVGLNSDGDIDEKSCKASTTSSTFSADTKYSDIAIYDIDGETRIPNIIVRTRKPNASAVNADGMVYIVDEFFETTGKDGEKLQGLRYFKGGQLEEKIIDSDIVSTCYDKKQPGKNNDSKNAPDIYKDATISDLSRGDALQFTTNSNGYISVFRPVFVQKLTTDNMALVTGGGSGYLEFPTFETFYGKISKRSSQILTLKVNVKEYAFSAAKPKVYLYNKATDKINVISVGDLQSYLKTTDIFVYSSRKTCQSIVVYE
ncbi:MAG: S-layer homology domain-containing protein [Oscillospiraceae bacterium]